ncbi:MAG: hypothetical protein GY772_28175 [bacterium]|nr:hypothetical protein [bacterium]
MLDAFKVSGGRLSLSKHNLHIHYSEKCMEDRRQRMRMTTAMSLHSFETAHVVLKEPISVEYKRRRHYDGSNVSDGIGPVSLTPIERAWTLTFKEKKDVYGKAGRVAPGGRTPGVSADEAHQLRRADTDLEPVFYFSLPSKFHEDILRGVGAHTVCGLTAGDGNEALACMRLGLPYTGICHTEAHKAHLTTWLASEVFKSFAKEDDVFYNAEIAKKLHDAGLPAGGRCP